MISIWGLYNNQLTNLQEVFGWMTNLSSLYAWHMMMIVHHLYSLPGTSMETLFRHFLLHLGASPGCIRCRMKTEFKTALCTSDLNNNRVTALLAELASCMGLGYLFV